MTNPINVQVLRPKQKWTDHVGTALGQIIAALINAWLLMVILGAVAPWHPGYGVTLLVIIGARCLLPSGATNHLQWTKAQR